MGKMRIFLAITLIGAAGSAALSARDHHGPSVHDAAKSVAMTSAEHDAHARAMFTKMDVNADGKIDANDRAAAQDRRFDAMDKDGNGQLSKDEVKSARAQVKERRGKMRDAIIGKKSAHPKLSQAPHREHKAGPMRMLRDADRDNDGAVTQDEFLAAAQARFSKADTNNDGKLSSDERAIMHAQVTEKRQ